MGQRDEEEEEEETNERWSRQGARDCFDILSRHDAYRHPSRVRLPSEQRTDKGLSASRRVLFLVCPLQ